MSAKRTLQRDHWLLICEGDKLSIGRNEHSDATEIPLADVHQLISDLREIAQAASPPLRLSDRLFPTVKGDPAGDVPSHLSQQKVSDA